MPLAARHLDPAIGIEGIVRHSCVAVQIVGNCLDSMVERRRILIPSGNNKQINPTE